jgi:hypothetical protein
MANKSKFGVLAQRGGAGTAPAKEARSANRRDNPAYCQFSAYLPKTQYRDVKIYLASTGQTLSEAVEQAFKLLLKSAK